MEPSSTEISAESALPPNTLGAIDLSELLETHGGALWGYILHNVRNRADAEDLFQEVNLKALNHLDSIREPERLRPWLFSIAMNTVRSFFRKRKMSSLEEVFEEAGEQPRSKAPNPLAQLEKAEQLGLLRTSLAKLPERDREILLLDVMAELPQKEIASQLDLNLNTVKTLSRRAKIKLARLMAEENHG